MPLQLTIACGDYDRTHPLIDGSIKPEGIELNWLVLPHFEIWTRMLNYYDFDVSEISLSSYIIARTLGKPLTAIPVFPARAFRHSYIFINTKSGIREPKDLMGKRVGLAEFQQTATVWIRGILQHEYGVKLDDVQWYTWAPHQRMEINLPERYKVTRLTPDRKPDQMLFDGELDAIMVPSLFPSLFNPPPHVRRLFENSPKVEAEYFKKTGIFPIMHSVALRQDVWEKHPWIARSLFKAFQRAKEDAYAKLKDLSPYKISLAWFRGPVEEQEQILGDDPWPYGVEKNRHVVQTLMTYLHEQGLAEKKLEVAALFAPNTLDL
jgi:4,5-dihydroxyphthalate decarboxylase